MKNNNDDAVRCETEKREAAENRGTAQPRKPRVGFFNNYLLVAIVAVAAAGLFFISPGKQKDEPIEKTKRSDANSGARPSLGPESRRSLRELAADTEIENAAFPPGSGIASEHITYSSSVGTETPPKPSPESRSTVSRYPKEPNRSSNAGSLLTGLLGNDVAARSHGKHSGGAEPAGMPAIRSNGQQALREVLGKQRNPPAAGQVATRPIDDERGNVVGSGGSQNRMSRAQLAEDFAPYGRLVKCELVFTIDSLNLETPIVGLVMEDVWWNGKLIIPAGAEAFSKAVPKRVLNRMGDDGTWTFVLPEQDDRINGRELVLKGFALDRAEVKVEDDGRVRSWSINDGSAGLQGYVVDNADPEKIKLFVATALSGAVSGLSEGLQTREPSTGLAGTMGLTQLKSTLRNATIGGVGQGARASLDLLAKQILDEVQQNGAYVRVPSGKQFYVFVDQSIDPTAAKVGLRLN